LTESTTDALGAAGVCPEIVWGDRVYRLGHPTQRAKAAFCDLIADAEFRGVQTALARGYMTEAKADAAVERLGQRIDRREHQPGGELFYKYSLGSEAGAGAVLFLLSLFRENHPGMTREDVAALSEARPAEVKFAVRRVVPLFLAWALERVTLTDAQRAALDAKLAATLDAAFGPATPSASP